MNNQKLEIEMKTVSAADLKPCDVLLYNRYSVISDAMKLFDGSDYSHSGIYNDGCVIEAISKGVVKNSLTDSVKETVFVDVYRFKDDNGGRIGDAEYPSQSVIDVMNKYASNGDRYSYESVLLLAVLTSARKLRVPVVSWMLRNILENALSVLNRITEAGKQPMICSELVFRCFNEALPKFRYDLSITGVDTMKSLPMGSEAPDKMFMGTSEELNDINSLRTEFLSKMAANQDTGINHKNTEGALKSIAVPDYVTPRDLISSRNLELVGRLAANN